MLETKVPREQSGRDSYGRYRAQIRSAAMASLAILEGGKIDRVYCDLHDDFVVRVNDGSGIRYDFVQVKTKGKVNHCWTLLETFGINSQAKDQSKQNTAKIKDSFIGKLLLHTVIFEKTCNTVIFQTNIHLHDTTIAVVEDIQSGKMENKHTKVLLDTFNDCYKADLSRKLSVKQIKSNLSKLRFSSDVQYLKDKGSNFESLVMDEIYKYSEIDLHRNESKEILLKLLDLVDSKTCGIIHEINAESIEKLAGISIDDLLSILSISKDAYEILLKGGDDRAIKSVSIIQRLFKNSGAGASEIEYCSRCKTDWDLWLRNNRHVLLEYDLNLILQQVQKIISTTIGIRSSIDLLDLKAPIELLLKNLSEKNLLYDLNNDLILGGVFSELVKGRS